MTEERDVRKQALWQSRNRAMKLLADKFPDEFRRLRDQELKRLDQPPVDHERARKGAVRSGRE